MIGNQVDFDVSTMLSKKYCVIENELQKCKNSIGRKKLPFLFVLDDAKI